MSSSKSSSSFGQAWRVLGQARVVFSVFLIAAMVINLAIFMWVYFKKPLAPLIDAQTVSVVVPPAGAESATTQSADADADADARASARRQADIFKNVMYFTGVLGVVGITFMLFCALVGLMVLIAGNLPGAGAVTSAFFYALAGAMLMLLNWGDILGRSVACMAFPCGVVTFDQLFGVMREIGSAGSTLGLSLGLWVRFVVYPVLILLFAVMYLGRTGQAHAQMSAGTAADDVNRPM